MSSSIQLASTDRANESFPCNVLNSWNYLAEFVASSTPAIKNVEDIVVQIFSSLQSRFQFRQRRAQTTLDRALASDEFMDDFK